MFANLKLCLKNLKKMNYISIMNLRMFRTFSILSSIQPESKKLKKFNPLDITSQIEICYTQVHLKVGNLPNSFFGVFL